MDSSIFIKKGSKVGTKVKEQVERIDVNPNSQSLNVDAFLNIVGGYGRFQWILTAIFGLFNFPMVFQIYIMYFTAQEPNWRCTNNSTRCTLNGTYTKDNDFRCKIPRNQWEFVKPESYSTVLKYNIYCDLSWLAIMTTSIFFFGNLLGCLSLGWLADRFGRKKVMFSTLLAMLAFTLLSTAMPNIESFLFCRFVVGYVSAGNQSLLMMSEFVSTKFRPVAINILWAFWTTSLCFLALQSYLVPDWKILFIITSAPYFILLLSYVYVPESIRWLRSMGRIDEAISILKKISDWNAKTLDPNLKMSLPVSDEHKKNITPLDLFKSKYLAISSSIQGFMWFVNGMVYYGLSLAADQLGGSLHLNFVLLSLAELPAAFLAMDFSHRFGRRISTCISIILGGIFCCVVPLITKDGNGNTIRIILGVLGKLLVTMSYDIISNWSLEIYPTSIRSIGLNYVSLTSTIGATASPWIAQGLTMIHESVPFLVTGGLAVVAGFVGFILPETKGRETTDTLQEINEIKPGRLIGNSDSN